MILYVEIIDLKFHIIICADKNFGSQAFNFCIGWELTGYQREVTKNNRKGGEGLCAHYTYLIIMIYFSNNLHINGQEDK